MTCERLLRPRERDLDSIGSTGAGRPRASCRVGTKGTDWFNLNRKTITRLDLICGSARIPVRDIGKGQPPPCHALTLESCDALTLESCDASSMNVSLVLTAPPVEDRPSSSIDSIV